MRRLLPVRDAAHLPEPEAASVGNTYAALFRVNSVFFDPSIYGRFLVVALVATAVLIVRGKSLRAGLAALAFTVVAWLGLLISFSQSSFAALFVAVFCLCAFVWRWKALVVLVAAVVLLVGGSGRRSRSSCTRCATTTSRRSTRSRAGAAASICNGLRIAKRHPVDGVGLGGFRAAYSKLTHRTTRQSASHNTPVTVAAEGGVIGLALFPWLLIAFGARRRSGGSTERSRATLALAAGLALVAIFAHSNAYNDFFEDPTTWIVFGLIGLAASVAPQRSAMIEP